MAKTATTQSILDWIETLSSRSDAKVLTGQHLVGSYSNTAIINAGWHDHITRLFEETGSYPAIVGAGYGYGSTNATRTLQNRYLIDHWLAGGLVTIYDSAGNPWTGGDASDLTNRDLIALLSPVDPIDVAANAAWYSHLDDIASNLQEFYDNDIPVLFRPLHEMTFASAHWWDSGAHPGNPNPYIALWQDLWDYLTITKGLNNLIWVFSTANRQFRPGIDYYPGDAYVDIVGADVYLDSMEFLGDEYADLLGTGKPICYAECGPGASVDGSYNNMLQINRIKADYPEICYLLRWSSGSEERAIIDCVNAQAFMDDSWMINLGDVDWADRSAPVFTTDANLSALWQFEQNGTDVTGNNDLIPINAPAYSAMRKQGSYSVDIERFSTQYLQNTSPVGLTITEDISFGGWYWIESLLGSETILGRYDSVSNDRGYILWIDSSGYVRCNLSSDGFVSATAYSGAQLEALNWYHIVAVYNGSDIRLYINGYISSGQYNPLIYSDGIHASAANLVVGANDSGTAAVDGLLDELFIFDRELTPQEVADIFENNIREVDVTTTSTTTLSTTSTTTLSTTSTSTLSTTSTTTLSTTSTSTLSTTSTTTLPPETPRGHRESRSLSVLVFTPTIGSYTVRGIYNGELGKNINSYSHTIGAVGGYLGASFTIFDRLNMLEDWLYGLGRHIEVYNPSLSKIWEGFVNRVTLNVGPLSIVRGPLSQIANRVQVVYSSVDTDTDPPTIGTRERTSVANDTNSQSKYGIIQKILSVGGTTETEAEQIRDTWLSENAEPETDQQYNNQSQAVPSVTVECLGYVNWLNFFVYNQTALTDTLDVSTQIQNVLAADPNGLFSTDYSGIETNALEVTRYADDDAKGWDYIKALTSRGDASDTRYTFGIYNDRKAVYASRETIAAYMQRLTDPKVRIETPTGQEVKPWDMQPAKWNFYPDFLIGKTIPTSLRKDPRYEFVETLTYSQPWGLQHSGSKVATLNQKLAKLGLGGTG